MDRSLTPVFDEEDRRFAAELFEEVGRLSAAGRGVSRPCYSETETAALELIAAAARAAGLATRMDGAAHLLVELPGPAGAPAYWTGSHVDTVPEGGNYDGLAGVIAGLLCLRKAKQRGDNVRPLTLLCMRGEEAVYFGRPYLGSALMFGLLGDEDLARPHRNTGRALRDYLRETGVDLARVERGEPIVNAGDIGAWFELHIEQGPVLLARGLPVGVVTGIRGNLRHANAHCIGVPGHSGAVPREMRHDAVLALAHLLSRLDDRWGELVREGTDLVMTTGEIGTNPEEHALTRIPGDVRFSLDIRSQSTAVMEDFYAYAREEMDRLQRERGVRFDLDTRIFTEPAAIDAQLAGRLRSVCDGLAIPYMDIGSGAGHDAAVFAKSGVPSAMVFVRNDHGSHNPDEAMEIDDFMLGTEVLYQALAR